MIYSSVADQKLYPFILPDLPFDKSDFEPHLSKESFDYHYGKHHQAYVSNLNGLLKDRSELHHHTLESLIINFQHDTAIFNNAAQVWNHSFFWHSLKTPNTSKPSDVLMGSIVKDFSSFEYFVKKFKEIALSQFGSGWVWLVKNSNNSLELLKTSNAETPITKNLIPILACDVWEHSYYIDYRNKRNDYIDTYLNHMVNWDFALSNLVN